MEIVVAHLEDCPLFNAGKGSVFTSLGTHEMDASIMDGSNLQAGAVSAISGVKNPVKLARLVMEEDPGACVVIWPGREEFAHEMVCDFSPLHIFMMNSAINNGRK